MLMVVGEYLPESGVKDSATRMAEEFRTRVGNDPPGFAFDGYCAVLIIAAAMEKAGSSDPEKVASALDALTLLTPQGTYEYDPTDHTGLGPDQVAVNTVRNGEIVPTEWTLKQLANTLQ